MSATLFTQKLKESRRDVLVSHYIANHDFGTYNDKITNSNDLYEYLLLDTKISNAVTTSRLSEAVSSLQLLIHRGLEGYEGELTDSAPQYLAKGAFLDNWDQYNKRYSTWAGKEKLRFYAGNYVEPSLRLNKTQLFKDLEDGLTQSKLTESFVFEELNNYFSQYDELARIEIITVIYNAGYSKKLYVIGEVSDNYYLRTIDPEKEGFYAWGEWERLSFLNGHDISKDDIAIIEQDSIHIITFKYEAKTMGDGGESTTTKYEAYIYDERGGYKQYEFPLFFDAQSENADYGSRDVIYISGKSVVITWLGGGVYRIYNDLTWNVGQQIVVNIYNADNISVATHTIDYRHNGYITLHEGDKVGITHPAIGSFHGQALSSMVFNDSWAYAPKHAEVDISGNIIPNGVFNTLAPDLYINYMYTDTQYLGGQGYELQELMIAKDINVFSGAYGQYLWEIFFHIPYLVATRFATEQRFEEAERWYKYIFNSAGYRDEDGNLIMDGKEPRYWNCYPLQQDTAWDALVDMPASTDPDKIATADPMHYKLAIFQHTLDLLIARGDSAYRLLERDTLTEAKMYYVQAQQLLGPRPDIRISNTWDNPTLEQSAVAIDKPATRDGQPQSFAQWLRTGDHNEMGDGDFLPAYNDVLLTYWDKLDVRLFNLRHNLSLSGQPLDLPLFATPVDPKELHRQQSGGDGVQGDASPANNIDTGWRYPLLADHARNAASQLSQFGSSLLNALERRDSEQLTILLQTQQIAVLVQQQDIAQKNLDSLGETLTSMNVSLASAQLRKNHYTQLINGNLSVQELKGLTLRMTSRGMTLASQAMATAGGALSALPNTFGLANGGGDFGAPLHAASHVMQIIANSNEQAAIISDISAGYLRRAEEWGLQNELADKDVEQIQAQIDSLNAQIAMQQKQILLTETESANAQALYDFHSNRFTGQALYNWMVGRLSTLYYQFYDNTVPVCLQACKALTRELGSDKADGLFNTSVWNDLYQGLLAGEGLTCELQKLNNVWLQNSALGLEATRTVSLAMLRDEENGNLRTAISNVLLGNEDESSLGKLQLKGEIFSAVLDLSTLGLDSAYNDIMRRRFIKSISVTLPTLLGPYQDIEATLSAGGQMATLSHGIQDAGRFVTNFDDSRFLPFEGMELKKDVPNLLTLNIFNVKESDEAVQNQRAIVENLSDIIFHIHYIMR